MKYFYNFLGMIIRVINATVLRDYVHRNNNLYVRFNFHVLRNMWR